MTKKSLETKHQQKGQVESCKKNNPIIIRIKRRSLIIKRIEFEGHN